LPALVKGKAPKAAKHMLCGLLMQRKIMDVFNIQELSFLRRKAIRRRVAIRQRFAGDISI
jgi:hypothetical protein